MGDLDGLVDQIRKELNMRFTDPDDPGLFERRKRLRILFGRIHGGDAVALRDRLGDRPTGDELSGRFHGRLSTATRRELLAILTANATADGPTPSEPSTDTDRRRPGEEAPISPREPLPASASARFRDALRALDPKVRTSTDDRKSRYLCWFNLLGEAGDDRVIPWRRICPATSGATGAALIIGPCDMTAGMPVDQATLEASISAVGDVEAANEDLGFITHLRSEIVVMHELTSEDLLLDNLRIVHDDVIRAINKLRVWADSPIPLDGVSEAMPPAYVAIKDWIGTRQRDPNSIYSCL